MTCMGANYIESEDKASKENFWQGRSVSHRLNAMCCAKGARLFPSLLTFRRNPHYSAQHS